MVGVPINHHCEYQRRKAHCLDDGDEGVVAKVTHDSTIHAESDKERNGNDGGADENPEMNPDRVVHIVNAKTDDEPQPERNPNQKNICGDLYESLLPTRQI
ncbi:hypothetical protein D3C84_924260 [compost metagenome]